MYSNIRTIRVGTFNLMNFMLPNRPAYNGTLCYNNEEYRHKSEWVEFMLNQIDADIIGFQELFHRDALVRIIKNNPRYRKARLYMAEETGEQPSVALLSRYPVENIEVFTHFPEDSIIDFFPKGRERVSLPFTTFTRPVIKADIRIPNYGLITVFVIHLKSKREIFYSGESETDPVDLARAQSRSLMLRASESVAVRSIVSRSLEIPDRPVILCGDVNDTGNAVTSRIISGEVPQHRLSDSVKRRCWELLLYHVKDIQARRSYQDFYYTHIHNGMYESLDHIMVSQELVTEYPRNTGRVGLVSVYNDHLVDQTFTTQGVDKCKSDHGVVVCSIELDLDRAAKFIQNNEDYYDADDIRSHKDVMEALDETPVQRPAVEDDESEPAPVPMFNMQNSLDRWKSNHQAEARRPAERHVVRRNPRNEFFRDRKTDTNDGVRRRSEGAGDGFKERNNIQNKVDVIEFKEENVINVKKDVRSETSETRETRLVEQQSDKTETVMEALSHGDETDLRVDHETKREEIVADLLDLHKSNADIMVQEAKASETAERGRTRQRTTTRRPMVQQDAASRETVSAVRETVPEKSVEKPLEIQPCVTCDETKPKTVEPALNAEQNSAKDGEKETRRRTHRASNSGGSVERRPDVKADSVQSDSAPKRTRRKIEEKPVVEKQETVEKTTVAQPKVLEKTETVENIERKAGTDEPSRVRRLFRPVPVKTVRKDEEKGDENAPGETAGNRVRNRVARKPDGENK